MRVAYLAGNRVCTPTFLPVSYWVYMYFLYYVYPVIHGVSDGGCKLRNVSLKLRNVHFYAVGVFPGSRWSLGRYVKAPLPVRYTLCVTAHLTDRGACALTPLLSV
jgi:hypothetical protein